MEKQWQAEQAKLAAEARAAAAASQRDAGGRGAMKFQGRAVCLGGAPAPAASTVRGWSSMCSHSWASAFPILRPCNMIPAPMSPGDELEPGDLVFFGNPIHHVGIYVGNGDMIDAPYTGVSVRIDPLQSDYAGATRIF